MTAPVLAGKDERGRRFYAWEGRGRLEQFWSVTTIISGGVPKYLGPHYAKMAAELALGDVEARGKRAIRHWTSQGRLWIRDLQADGQLKSLKLEKISDRELALRWLKGAADRHRDAAAERGSTVHDEAERLVLEHVKEAARLLFAGESLPAWDPEIAPYMRSFVAWVEDFRPSFELTEATVFNRTQAYAGTLDAGAHVWLPEAPRLWTPENGGRVWSPEHPLLGIIDYKSGRQVYSEVALQLAAYARAEFIGGPDRMSELPVPRFDAAFVLHLTPKGYAFREVEISERVFRAFLYAREVYRWVVEIAPEVLGEALRFEGEEVA